MCERLGLAPLELLRTVADAGCRFSICVAQLIAAASHPEVVEKTIECALTDEGFDDRVVLHKAMGFLPTPPGSLTAIAIIENAHAKATGAAQQVTLPPVEETIRELQQAWSKARRLAPAPRIPREEATSGG